MKIYLAGGMKDGWQDQLPSNHEWLDPRSWQHDDPAVYTQRDLDVIAKTPALALCAAALRARGEG